MDNHIGNKMEERDKDNPLVPMYFLDGHYAERCISPLQCSDTLNNFIYIWLMILGQNMPKPSGLFWVFFYFLMFFLAFDVQEEG